MPRGLLLVGLLLALCAPMRLAAQEAATNPEDLRFELRREARTVHPSETSKYRELGIGELGFSFALFYAAHSYNITDIRGHDHSLATNWLYSFDPWGVGGRVHAEYRLSSEWRLSFIQTADVAFGILNNAHHETFEFETLPFTQNYRAANDAQKLSLNLEFEFSARWRWLWFTAKANSWMVFRRTHVRANRDNFFDSQLGEIDKVKDRDRLDWDNAYLLGASTGVGFEFFFVDEATRFVLFAMWRPFNVIHFRDATGIANGFELMVRSTDFDLTNQSGLFFSVSFQAYLDTDEFNRVYFTQLSFGIRWR